MKSTKIHSVTVFHDAKNPIHFEVGMGEISDYETRTVGAIEMDQNDAFSITSEQGELMTTISCPNTPVIVCYENPHFIAKPKPMVYRGDAASFDLITNKVYMVYELEDDKSFGLKDEAGKNIEVSVKLFAEVETVGMGDILNLRCTETLDLSLTVGKFYDCKIKDKEGSLFLVDNDEGKSATYSKEYFGQ